MLFSHISIAEKYNYLSERFQRAYQWLRDTKLDTLEVGAYEIGGADVIANVQEYDTLPASECPFETHDAYFDIQYLISGKEMFGVCKREGLVIKEEKPENDVIFYEEPELSGQVLLLSGDLIIVAPEDAHKPRCLASTSEFVRKVVIKVLV